MYVYVYVCVWGGGEATKLSWEQQDVSRSDSQ
jgi:hypothetical protein